MDTHTPHPAALRSAGPHATLTTVMARAALPLLAGSAGFVILWIVGAREHGWLAFVVAAMATTLGGAAPLAQGDVHRRTDRGRDDAALVPGTYSFGGAGSSIEVSSRKLSMFPVRSRLEVDGSIQVTEPIDDSSVAARISLASFNSSNPMRDRHVTGPAFLDVVRHPTANFSSMTIRRTGAELTVGGNLELHGQSSFVFLAGWCRMGVDEAGDDVLLANVEAELSRTAWGIKRFRWLVSDGTRIRVKVAATREADHVR